MAQMTLSRATIREFDDNHLMQQVKAADVYHSETHTDFERWQMVGITAMPLKQEEDQQQGQQGQQQQSSSNGGKDQGDWNHNQPKGKAAEAIMMYVGGSRSHPIAMVDDRRVRPYALKEGESSFYAASGTGQMVFHNDKGSYLVATNNPPEQSKDSNDKERFASLRHVSKKKQSRKISKGQSGSGGQGQSQQAEDPHHEGETVNTEVRTTKTRIEFRVGDKVVGYYDKDKDQWAFVGTVKLGSEDADRLVHRKDDVDSLGDVAVESAKKVYAA